MNHSKLIGSICAILVIVVWGTTFVSSKALLNAGLEPAAIFFARFLMAYVCMIAIAQKKFLSDNWKDELTMVGLGVMGGSLYFLTENMALVYSTSSNVSILVSTTPLVTMLMMSAFYSTERMQGRHIIGSILAFIGTVLVVLNGQYVLHLNPLGDSLALLASLCWAFYSLFMRRVMDRYRTDFITRKVFGYGVLSIIPYIIFFEPFNADPEIWFSPTVILNTLFLGLIASTGCYLLWNWVMRVLGAVRSTNFIYLQPFVTMLFGAIFLGERITLLGFTGVVILIIGMFAALGKTKIKNKN